MKSWRLLADIGGTNARFARSRLECNPFSLRNYKVADFSSFNEVFKRYVADTDGLQGCNGAAVCAAGPVLDGQVQLTNVPWRISEAEISQLAGKVPVVLCNDLEAVALALPHLGNADLMPIGKFREPPSLQDRMLAINVGTGFGAAVIMPSGGSWVTCPSEAGHISFGAQDKVELALLAGDHSSIFTVEDALSGHGLVHLYRKQCERLGIQMPATAPEEVFAKVSSDAAAEATLSLFTVWLGRVARNLTLATSAWGGVFLTGGVVRGWHGNSSSCEFRTSFEAAQKMQEPLRRTYTGVIKCTGVSLLGLARAHVA